VLHHGIGAHHHVRSFRAKARLGKFVGEAYRIIGIGADESAEPRDPPDPLLCGIGEMHDDRAVIGARIFRHQLFQNVQHHFEAEVAVDVDVNLIARVPEQARAPFDLLGRFNPFAVMAIEIAVFHLHQLRDDRAVNRLRDESAGRHSRAAAQKTAARFMAEPTKGAGNLWVAETWLRASGSQENCLGLDCPTLNVAIPCQARIDLAYLSETWLI
jgi:hypothetical protein